MIIGFFAGYPTSYKISAEIEALIGYAYGNQYFFDHSLMLDGVSTAPSFVEKSGDLSISRSYVPFEFSDTYTVDTSIFDEHFERVLICLQGPFDWPDVSKTQNALERWNGLSQTDKDYSRSSGYYRESVYYINPNIRNQDSADSISYFAGISAGYPSLYNAYIIWPGSEIESDYGISDFFGDYAITSDGLLRLDQFRFQAAESGRFGSAIWMKRVDEFKNIEQVPDILADQFPLQKEMVLVDSDNRTVQFQTIDRYFNSGEGGNYRVPQSIIDRYKYGDGYSSYDFAMGDDGVSGFYNQQSVKGDITSELKLRIETRGEHKLDPTGTIKSRFTVNDFKEKWAKYDRHVLDLFPFRVTTGWAHTHDITVCLSNGGEDANGKFDFRKLDGMSVGKTDTPAEGRFGYYSPFSNTLNYNGVESEAICALLFTTVVTVKLKAPPRSDAPDGFPQQSALNGQPGVYICHYPMTISVPFNADTAAGLEGYVDIDIAIERHGNEINVYKDGGLQGSFQLPISFEHFGWREARLNSYNYLTDVYANIPLPFTASEKWLSLPTAVNDYYTGYAEDYNRDAGIGTFYIGSHWYRYGGITGAQLEAMRVTLGSRYKGALSHTRAKYKKIPSQSELGPSRLGFLLSGETDYQVIATLRKRSIGNDDRFSDDVSDVLPIPIGVDGLPGQQSTVLSAGGILDIFSTTNLSPIDAQHLFLKPRSFKNKVPPVEFKISLRHTTAGHNYYTYEATQEKLSFGIYLRNYGISDDIGVTSRTLDIFDAALIAKLLTATAPTEILISYNKLTDVFSFHIDGNYVGQIDMGDALSATRVRGYYVGDLQKTVGSVVESVTYNYSSRKYLKALPTNFLLGSVALLLSKGPEGDYTPTYAIDQALIMDDVVEIP